MSGLRHASKVILTSEQKKKIVKARKCLNMATSIGIIKGGINIRTCNVIYQSVVLPTVCFGCEVWFLKEKDEQLLLAFQRYAARRIQRLHPRSLNVTSTACFRLDEYCKSYQSKEDNIP